MVKNYRWPDCVTDGNKTVGVQKRKFTEYKACQQMKVEEIFIWGKK